LIFAVRASKRGEARALLVGRVEGAQDIGSDPGGATGILITLLGFVRRNDQ